MGKNIVICCDGTGNQIGGPIQPRRQLPPEGSRERSGRAFAVCGLMTNSRSWPYTATGFAVLLFGVNAMGRRSGSRASSALVGGAVVTARQLGGLQEWTASLAGRLSEVRRQRP
jgi:hypothetical protein